MSFQQLMAYFNIVSWSNFTVYVRHMRVNAANTIIMCSGTVGNICVPVTCAVRRAPHSLATSLHTVF